MILFLVLCLVYTILKKFSKKDRVKVLLVKAEKLSGLFVNICSAPEAGFPLVNLLIAIFSMEIFLVVPWLMKFISAEDFPGSLWLILIYQCTLILGLLNMKKAGCFEFLQYMYMDVIRLINLNPNKNKFIKK